MRVVLILPILIPFLTSIACVLAWKQLLLQRIVGLAGAALLLGAGVVLLVNVAKDGIAVSQMGGWPAPFGITIVADHLAALMILAVGVVVFSGLVYSVGFIDRPRESFGYYPLFFFMVMGACGAILTGDIFNLFVWIELMVIASFVMLSLGGERLQLSGGIKYALLNILSSFLLLAGIGLLYGLTGTLNMADLAQQLRSGGPSSLVTAVAMVFFVALGIKAGAFPLFFWLPASYPAPPVVVTAIFSALLTKVGVYAMFRLFALMFSPEVAPVHGVILVLGGFTMLTGVLGAVAQDDLRRLLSFHIISQVGYMVMGIGLATAFALGAAIYFVIHIMIAKMALFLAAGVAWRLQGTYDLHKLGGFYRHRPLLATLFLIPALSLGGMPPLSGFIGKLSLVQAGLEQKQYTIVAVALVVSILTLYSMVKIWTLGFWEPVRTEDEPGTDRFGLLMIPIAILAAATIGLGVYAGPLFDLAVQAGQELTDPQQYIQAVLGESAR